MNSTKKTQSKHNKDKYRNNVINFFEEVFELNYVGSTPVEIIASTPVNYILENVNKLGFKRKELESFKKIMEGSKYGNKFK